MSGINQGIPIDRFWAVLQTKAKGGIDVAPKVIVNVCDALKLSAAIKKSPTSTAIEIPNSIVEIKKRDIKTAISIRLASRKIFQKLFSAGYVIKGFYRKNGKNFYVAVKDK